MSINVLGSIYVRNLLTELLQVSDEYDDLSDLKPSEMEQVKEWELQFRFKKFQSPTLVNHALAYCSGFYKFQHLKTTPCLFAHHTRANY